MFHAELSYSPDLYLFVLSWSECALNLLHGPAFSRKVQKSRIDSYKREKVS